MVDDLKPCPFCGNKAEVTDTCERDGTPYSVVFCTACFTMGRKMRFHRDAVYWWNHRVSK